MLNNHKIILLLQHSTYLSIDLFWWEKSHNYEIILYYLQIVFRNSFDPDPDWDFWLDPDGDFLAGSETLLFWSLSLLLSFIRQLSLFLLSSSKIVSFCFHSSGIFSRPCIIIAEPSLFWSATALGFVKWTCHYTEQCCGAVSFSVGSGFSSWVLKSGAMTL